MQALQARFGFGRGDTQSGPTFAAMASIALRQGISRVVSFPVVGGLDTHNTNWQTDQAPAQRRGFQVVSDLAAELESHEYGNTGESWLDRTVIVGYSEFSRTPVLNGAGGRDHSLTNACFVLGGGIRGGRVIGASSDVGMAPQPVDLATGRLSEGGEVVRPAHLFRALLAHVGFDDDVAGLRVPTLTTLLA